MNCPWKFCIRDFKFITNRSIKKIQIAFEENIIYCENFHQLSPYNLFQVQPIYNHGIGKFNPRGEFNIPHKVKVRVECLENGPNPLWVQMIYNYCSEVIAEAPNKSYFLYNSFSLKNHAIIHQDYLLQSSLKFPFEFHNNYYQTDYLEEPFQYLIYTRNEFVPLGQVHKIIYIDEQSFKCIEFGVYSGTIKKSVTNKSILILFAKPVSNKPFYVLFKDRLGVMVKAVNFDRLKRETTIFPDMHVIELNKEYYLETSEPTECWIGKQYVNELIGNELL